MSFTNYHKQMKVPFLVYADFECVIEKIHGCEPAPDESFTVKTERHVPCGFSYIVVRSDGKLYGPFNHRGRDAVYVFLMWLQNHEREMREDIAHKRPLFMTPEDWKKHRKATDCQNLQQKPRKGLILGLYLCAQPRHWKIQRTKPQKMLLYRNETLHRAPKRKKTKR